MTRLTNMAPVGRFEEDGLSKLGWARREMQMELWEAINGRRSIRHFTEDPVPDGDLLRIITAAGKAPSGGNQQPWRFIAIRNRELLKKMGQAVIDKIDEMTEWEAAENYKARVKAVKGYGLYFSDAPVAIAALTEPYDNPIDQFVLPAHGLSFEQVHNLRGDPATQSLGAAIMLLCLAAHEMGYGTCWMSGPMFASAEMEKFLNIERPWRLAAIIALGTPTEHPAPRPRLDPSEVLKIID